MKSLVVFLLMLAVFSVTAQMPIEVKVVERPSSMGVQSAFEVVVPQAKANDAIDLWKKTIIPGGFLKKNPKMEKQKDEWIVKDVVINEITSSPLNVYTQISSFPENIYIRIFLQAEGGFIGSPNSSPQTSMQANDYIRKFAVDLYKKAVEKELKQEENKLKALENDLDNLFKKNKSFNNKIGDAEKDQAMLKGEVKQNEAILTNQQNNQEINLTPVDPEAREKLEKQLRANEKDLNKSQKAQKKYQKKVRQNLADQKEKTEEIEKQKQVVQEIKSKLGNIR